MESDNKKVTAEKTENVTVRLESQETAVAFAVGYRAAIRDLMLMVSISVLMVIVVRNTMNLD